MKNKFIIGRYLPMDSIIHQLDPRAKLCFVFFYIILIFFCRNFTMYAWMLVVLLTLMYLSKIKLWYLLKGLTPIIFFLIFTFLMHLFLTKGGETLFQWKFISIETGGIIEGIYIVCRLMFIMMVSTILTLTTNPISLTDAFDKILAPLKLVKVPVQQLSMMMSIALRFIPTLMEELDKIILAQKSRGSEISSGSIGQRIKAFIPLLIPLFISAFKRAEDLAIAMEVRGYDIKAKRSSYRKLQWQWKDSLLVVTLIPIGIILFLLKNIGVA